MIYTHKFISTAWNMHNTNPLKTQLNPICHLLALLGAHHILHVSRIRVNLNTTIYTHKFIINCLEYAQY